MSSHEETMHSTSMIARAVALSLCHSFLGGLLLFSICATAAGQDRSRGLQNPTSGDPVPKLLLLRIVRAEDERRWDDSLRDLFRARNEHVRERAALAAGRIGDEAAVPSLIALMKKDSEQKVQAMAAFALGEIESALAADALIEVVKNDRDSVTHARAIEALGKIAAALPKEQEARQKVLGAEILKALQFENRRRSASDLFTVRLGLTAVLRAKPDNAGPVVAEFLRYSNPRIRADAANTLARLKLNDGNSELRKMLTQDPDPVVRANAARVISVTDDKTSSAALLDRALKDTDSRVRVSAIRALGTLKDTTAVKPFLAAYPLGGQRDGLKINELLEVATAFGNIYSGIPYDEASTWLRNLHTLLGGSAPEVESALARLSPTNYLRELGKQEPAKVAAQRLVLTNWRAASSLAQGLGAIAALPDTSKEIKTARSEAQDVLRGMLDYRNSGLHINTLVAVHSEIAIPDVLRAYAAFKPKDLDDVLRKHLTERDVIIRGTAADLLGDLPPDETNSRALIAALPVALADKDLNDAALSILDSLAKQKNAKATAAIATVLGHRDYLIRRKAIGLLKANGTGDLSIHQGIVQTHNTDADYNRALSRIGRHFNAVVETSRGAFTIEFLPEAAPLTVDNFIQLANRRYFNGITIHRVVPNFVIQDGDPRGDGNGGPGYQIRCEINEVPYNRGAVGMALSGKDTGGSQWFVTHSPQPHLDGGYTVFGNVVSGMEVVDELQRGDVIRSITITEPRSRASRGRR
jgi:cyclophilin family peptidyl-prolyl cis-trans isomerase/HEAT repeat protein